MNPLYSNFYGDILPKGFAKNPIECQKMTVDENPLFLATTRHWNLQQPAHCCWFVCLLRPAPSKANSLPGTSSTMKVVSAEESCEQILANLPIEGRKETEDYSQPNDASSVDSTLYESDSCFSSGTSCSGKPRLRRRVSFNKIEIREYSVTIGDHPACRDGLALQLDWDHSEATEVNMLCSRERQAKFEMPRRLSYEEKRERLMALTDYTDQRDRNQALGQVIERMQSWWQQHPVLPMPKLYDIREEPTDSFSDDDSEERFPEIDPPCLEEYVFEWRRNHSKRSHRC